MIRAMVDGRVTYACYFDGEREEMIKQYAEENDVDIETAIWSLYQSGNLDIYRDYNESDYSTEGVIDAEEVDY